MFNGNNNAIENTLSLVSVGKIEGVTVARSKRESCEKVASSMTTQEETENKLAMAVEFDHMYIGCSESKATIGKDIEVQHLKDLLLLHLDLIQQQAEQLVAKDKQIKDLRDENDNVSYLIYSTLRLPVVFVNYINCWPYYTHQLQLFFCMQFNNTTFSCK